MSSTVKPVTHYLHLLERLRAATAGHPAAPRVSLMLSPPGLELRPGEVLVQHPTSDGGHELRPRRIASAVSDHAPQADTSSQGPARAAVTLASRLWTSVVRAGGPQPDSPRAVHVPGLFDPAVLQGLLLPIGEHRPETQTVVLVDQGIEMERSTGADAIADAYARRPRTRLYECVDIGSVGPYSIVALLLSQLAGCRVVCTIYESHAGDAKMGEHRDDWYGVIIQLSGAKQWRLRSDRSADPQSVTLNAGDGLLLPGGVWHDVITPDESVHVVYAILTDQPIKPTTP